MKLSLKLSRNEEGEKVLVVIFNGKQGFRVRTAVHLPLTNEMTKANFNALIAETELKVFVDANVNDRQRKLMAAYEASL